MHNRLIGLVFAIPLLSFLLLYWLEKRTPAVATDNQSKSHSKSHAVDDWLMNLSGFVRQGVVIPCLGYFLSSQVFPQVVPHAKGTLPLGFWGAFGLNVIGVDFLYYLQHRAFHGIPWLWKFHAPHHYAPVVNIWVTSRNALVTHFLFVYLLINPVAGFLCDAPDGFFMGAMVTAALDLFRHANIVVKWPVLSGIITLPSDHHRHHDVNQPFVNYGANWMIWDRLFCTADIQASDSQTKQLRPSAQMPCPSVTTQLFFPWKV
jgi:sterol desaturase/sphingolipid hydroxylase (fatty acid hydroxylase superfamily)